MSTSAKLKQRVVSAATLLAAAARPLRVLRTIDWPAAVRERFLARGARELPRVGYEPVDATRTLERVARARRIKTGHERIDARSIHDTIDHLTRGAPKFVAPPRQDAATVARTVRKAVRRHFGADAPAVRIMPTLSANALATSSEIRIRRDASFTDRDAQQLLQHEAWIHVATSINGKHQDLLPILGASYPYTARTQEGLSVFAEVISSTIELDRMRRLADRVVAIQMAIDGADFLQVRF